MPLSSSKLRNIKPSDKIQRLYDEKGLYLEVTPKGKTWWRFKYRFNDKEKRISLGVYPDVGLGLARERRDDARKLIANGVDPSEHRKVMKKVEIERTSNSFEVVAREWFVKHSQNWVKNHANRIIQRSERDIFHGLVICLLQMSLLQFYCLLFEELRKEVHLKQHIEH